MVAREIASLWIYNMNALRRCAWVLIGLAGLPGLAVGIVSLYAVFLIPIVFGSGLLVRRSQIGVGFALCFFCALIVAFAFGLGYGYGGHDWWFFSLYGTSCLLAMLATFKLGQEARVRLF